MGHQFSFPARVLASGLRGFPTPVRDPGSAAQRLTRDPAVGPIPKATGPCPASLCSLVVEEKSGGV